MRPTAGLAIREGIEQRAWDEPRRSIPIVAAIDELATQVARAASLAGSR